MFIWSSGACQLVCWDRREVTLNHALTGHAGGQRGGQRGGRRAGRPDRWANAPLCAHGQRRLQLAEYAARRSSRPERNPGLTGARSKPKLRPARSTGAHENTHWRGRVAWPRDAAESDRTAGRDSDLAHADRTPRESPQPGPTPQVGTPARSPPGSAAPRAHPSRSPSRTAAYPVNWAQDACLSRYHCSSSAHTA